MGFIWAAVVVLVGMLAYQFLTDVCHCPVCESVFPYYKILLQSDSFFHPDRVCPECGKILPQFVQVENSEDFKKELKKIPNPLSLMR